MKKTVLMVTIFIFVVSAFIVSCGHLANPAPPKVELTSAKDQEFSCNDIMAEIFDLQMKQLNVQKQIDSQRAQNILAGIGGYLVIVPYAFIDPTTQKNDSKYSYEQREEYIRQISLEKGCTNVPKPLGDDPPKTFDKKFQPSGGNVVQKSMPGTWRSKVVSVIDGDTIFVVDGGKRSKVVLYGIDAPEIGQPFGEEAKNYLQKLLGQIVDLQFVTRDSLRDCDMCVVHYGFSVNEEMLRAGLAWYSDRQSRRQGWKQYQSEAQNLKVGLWSDPNPVPPWEYRRTHAKTY